MKLKEDVIDAATESVAAAMGVARAIQQRSATADRLDKSDGSPVTVADFAVQAIVALRLRALIGDFHLVGEESAAALRQPEKRGLHNAVIAAVHTVAPRVSAKEVLEAIDLGKASGGASIFWTLDPIDGTKGFVRGRQYAIALGRIENGAVTHAWLGCPNLHSDPARDPTLPPDFDDAGTLLVAERDAGCWQRLPSAPRERGARVRRGAWSLHDPVRLCDSVDGGLTSRTRHAMLAAFADRIVPANMDSQTKYAVVARGQTDVYLRPPRPGLPIEQIWDHAAGTLVASEAGAVVSDLDGRALDFGQGRFLAGNRGVIACASELHGAILEGVRTVDLDALARA